MNLSIGKYIKKFLAPVKYKSSIFFSRKDWRAECISYILFWIESNTKGGIVAGHYPYDSPTSLLPGNQNKAQGGEENVSSQREGN